MDPQSRTFRATVGIVALFAGLIGLVGLFVVHVPEGNREPLLLALGVVLGWGSSVVQSEFGSSSTARRLADKALGGVDQPVQSGGA